MKVSVVAITYNHEAFIAQALESVLMQKVGVPYEIVVGDDCSTDRTCEIVSMYQEKYPDRISLLVSEKNIGDAGRANLLRAMHACRGQYVALLDGDDYWIDELKLEKQIQFLDSHPNCAACTSAIVDLLEDGTLKYYPAVKEGIYDLSEIVNSNFGPPFASTPMFRNISPSEFPDWFFTNRANGDKLVLFVNALRGQIGYFDEVTAVHRVHKKGLTLTRGHIQNLEIHLEKLKLLHTLAGPVFNGTRAQEIFKGYVGLARHYAREGHRRRALESIRNGMGVFPIGRLPITRNLAIAFLEIGFPSLARVLRRVGTHSTGS